MPLVLRTTGFLALALGVWGVLSGTALAQTPSPAPSPEGPATTEAGEPVVFDGREIFRVYVRLGPFSPKERALAISQRLEAVAVGPGFLPAPTLTVKDNGTTADVFAGDRFLMTVGDPDAAETGHPRDQVAEYLARTVEKALQDYWERYRPRSLIAAALQALLATAFLIAFVLLTLRGARAFLGLIASWHGRRIRDIRIQRLELVSADRIERVLRGVVRWTRGLLVAGAVVVWLGFVLGIVPWTRGLVRLIVAWIRAPLVEVSSALAASLPSLFFLLVIGLMTYYALRLARWAFHEVQRGTIRFEGFPSEWADPTYEIVRVFVLAFAVVVAFPYIPGSSSPAFQGVSVFLGVLVSLSSSSAISNVIAGVILTYTGAFRVGDRVRIGDTLGDVVKKTLLVTHVRTIKNVDVSIPNAAVLSGQILNYSQSAKALGLILNTSVTIGYDAPWRKVHELLLAAARATPGLRAEPAPFVLQTALNDFFVTYEINAYTDRPQEMAGTYSALHANIQARFNEAGVEIMSPHFASLRDGNRIAIPDAYVRKDHERRGFRIEK